MQETLKTLSYYNTGGKCKNLLLPTSIDELAVLIKDIHQNKTPFYVLGGGTNSLVMDEAWPGSVICLKYLDELKVNNNTITAQAGVINSILAETAYLASLSGIEWMNGLPGQLGGTVRMNARCYGGEISQVVRKIRFIDQVGKLHSIESPKDSKEVFQGYKETIFMSQPHIIVEATLELSKAEDSKASKEKMDFCLKDRESKGQFEFPTCGCVFKNNYSSEVSIPSGMLIEAAGCKAFKVGKAEVSPYHSNFLYNKGASAEDILSLSLKIRNKVFEEFGVWLQYEMEILGNIPENFVDQITEQRPEQYKKEKLQKLREAFKQRKPITV